MSGASESVSQLRALEAEAVHAVREVVAELERPVLLFSGGKDSIALLRVAEKAFRVGGDVALPFPVMHVDTGHNFPEVLDFRDRRLAQAGHRLIVASVQENIIGHCLCVLGDSMAMPVGAMVRKFRPEFEEHIRTGTCVARSREAAACQP